MEHRACAAQCPFCDHPSGRSDVFIWRRGPCAAIRWDADVDLRSTHSRGGHSRGPPPRVRRNRGAAEAARDLPIQLYGSRSTGWGLTNTSLSVPGPSLAVEVGDNVTLNLTSFDGNR